jgi:serine/threonine protein kinase
MDNPSPQRLGDFELVRELGRGGMGVVYEARQVSLNRRVALKVLGGDLGLTGKAVQRFRREAEAAARLHHTNIVPVYATGEQGGIHFYAMELIDGPSLDQVIRQLRQTSNPPQPKDGNVASADSVAPANLDATGPYVAPRAGCGTAGLSSSSLSSGSAYFDTVARLVAEVADALEYAHRQGVIHRDIKPSNLLLAPTGRLSVNDFGLARILEQPAMTMTGEFVGTPAYMSPEQIAAGRTPLDHRTDIYSLGATLYELLTLQPPFRGERRDQVLAQILHKEPRAPRKVNAKVPVDLETICLKALEKDPDRRYQAAGAMAEDLRRYLNRFAISARRAGPVQRLAKWVRRRPALAATLALAFVLALVAAFFAYHGYRTEQARLAEKRAQEEQLLIEKRQNALEKALLVAISGDLDAAEKAIEEAERQGVSTGQVRLLRGELAYYRGHVNEAIPHLEQAVQLLPVEQSAAARGLLVVAYVYDMRLDDGARELRDLEPIQPISAEDFLFKGAAVSQFDEARGLAILDQAVKQRPSSAIARLFRSDSLANLAANRADPAAADRAIDDAETAKRLLVETSPVALWYSANAYQLAAHVYKAAGMDEKYRRAMTLALKDVEALEPFKQLPDAAYVRTFHYWYFGQKDRTLDELRVLSQRLDTPAVCYPYALLLSWRGSPADFQEVRRIFKRSPRIAPLVILNCLAVAELEGREAALEFYPREIPRNTDGTSRVFLDTIPLLLGKSDLARAVSRADRERNLYFRRNEQVFFHTLLDYLAGVGNETDLLQAAADSRGNESQARYFLGMARLAEGDRTRAREQFQRAIATSCPNTEAYNLSVVFLARLEHDPTWPPWIPLKK